ncbi:hypothetical protein SteCoe_35217 [Stentor coeruleus]|uniref:Elongator complex protein 4 n=1 Tax=Stentor coeruleus TaxID=5963 RepID=A0A1R2ASX6_9CILI|nr:hypothetical protein SteCoe_35217 [Stentor coeruleus]
MEPVFVRHSKPQKKSLPKTKFGIPGLDSILSGGIYQGTLTFIEPDSYSKHYISFARCFLGEGATNKEKLFVYMNQTIDGFIPPVAKQSKSNPSKMRIAWRYEGQVSQTAVDEKHYDLTKSINYPHIHHPASVPDLYTQIYNDISNSLDSSTDTTHKRILILLPSISSEAAQLNSFLASLRALVRSIYAVCLLISEVPSDPLLSFTLLKNIDFGMKITDFDDKTDLGEYCASLSITKPLSLQSLGNFELRSLNFGIVREPKIIDVSNFTTPPVGGVGKSALEY